MGSPAHRCSKTRRIVTRPGSLVDGLLTSITTPPNPPGKSDVIRQVPDPSERISPSLQFRTAPDSTATPGERNFKCLNCVSKSSTTGPAGPENRNSAVHSCILGIWDETSSVPSGTWNAPLKSCLITCPVVAAERKKNVIAPSTAPPAASLAQIWRNKVRTLVRSALRKIIFFSRRKIVQNC